MEPAELMELAVAKVASPMDSPFQTPLIVQFANNTYDPSITTISCQIKEKGVWKL
jgi:hypothetical protein